MSKYVIRNCPAYNSKGEYYDCWENQLSWCENITDCKLKQIVELCKHVCLAEKHLIHKSSTFNLANEILQKFDIQEVE